MKLPDPNLYGPRTTMGEAQRYIQAKHSQCNYWETISPYTLFVFLTGDGKFQMSSPEALELIKNIANDLKITIDIEELERLS